MRGANLRPKHEEIKNIIRNNKLSLFAILESQVQFDKLQRTCSSIFGNSIFGNWMWISNHEYSNKGTRIIIGWDPEEMVAMSVDSSDQVMHCKIIFIKESKRIFASFIYACNYHMDRRRLWYDLEKHKSVIDNLPWILACW